MIRRPAFLKYFLIPLPKLGKGKRNPNKAKSENYKRAYPDELERREVKLLRKRRRNSSRISPKTEKNKPSMTSTQWALLSPVGECEVLLFA
jgi:hypothetical protein